MADSQFTTIISLIVTSIIINFAVLRMVQASINKRIDDINKRIDDSNKRVDDTNKRIDDIVKRLDSIDHFLRVDLPKMFNETQDRFTERIDNIFHNR